MKILKKILIILLCIIALIFIAAIIAPKSFNTKSEIIVHRPNQEVFDYVKYIKNQDNYGKWQLMDPNMKKEYQGEDGTVGFKYSWDSEVLGKGSQTITEVIEGKEINTLLDFGWDGANCYMQLEPVDSSSCRVKWGIYGKTPIPFNLMSLFFDISKDFDEGLNNLKVLLEKNN